METTTSRIGSYAPDFELPGTDGAVHHLARYLDQYNCVVMVFVSPSMASHTPAILDQLAALHQDLLSQAVPLIALNSYPDRLPLDAMRSIAEQHSLACPYLRDMAQDVAQTLGVDPSASIPAAFVIDRQWILRYQGTCDVPQGPEAEPMDAAIAYGPATQALRQAVMEIVDKVHSLA
jgi:peroxiredoxin